MRAQVLATPRTVLRPLAAADAPELHALWTAPGVRRYLWDDQVIPAGQTAEIVARSTALHAQSGLGLWAARPRAGGAGAPLLGFAGYWYFRESPEGADLELLYGIAEPFWGQGYAGELAAALVRYGFEELGWPEIRASTDAPNVASIRVLEKAGFVREREAVVGGLATLFFRLPRQVS